MLTLVLTKIMLPPGVDNPIVVTLSQKEYYSSNFTLIDDNVTVNPDGTIVASPPLSFLIDPAEKYIIRAENQACGFIYDQAVIINPYCPIDFTLSDDLSYCFKDEITQATPPSSPELLIAKSNNAYNTCGSYIYATGYNVNGTGTSSQVTLVNTFWRNGGSCVDNNSTDGMMNRAAVWTTTQSNNQTIGFSVCLTIEEEKTYYVAICCDNSAIINVDGVNIITQNETALNAQYSVGGAAFKVNHIYPVTLQAGERILELIGMNVNGAAALACEIYDNSPAEIIAATSYGDLELIFSSKDEVGRPAQLGSNGIGYSCEDGYALQYCQSPIVCRRTVVTNVLY